MEGFYRHRSVPVLLLHNLDPSWAPEDTGQASKEVRVLESAMRQVGHPVTNAPLSDADLQGLLNRYDPRDYVVLNWCEEIPGVPRSDASVAMMLGNSGFSYTGSPPEVLALSWDKPRVKFLLDRHCVPTPKWRIYHSSRVDGWDCYPAIVKPALEHCSLGVTTDAVVFGPEELRARIAYVLGAFHQPALVEDFIDGREFHISLLGNGVPVMLPPAEMDFAAFGDLRDRLCTFDSKFTPGSIHYNGIQLLVPAPLTESEFRSLEKTACAAYHVLGCRDYARVDIRLRNGIFYVLDINPNADISYETSMAYAAGAAGYSYGEMASQLVHFAAQRHPLFRDGTL